MKAEKDRHVALYCAMIEQAISDFIHRGLDEAMSVSKADQAGEVLAVTWIFGNQQDYPYSFENVCEVTGVNPDELRSKLVNDVLREYGFLDADQ